MNDKKSPERIYLLPDNKSLWLRSLVATAIASICLTVLSPILEEMLRQPEYWLGKYSGKLQVRVAFYGFIFGPIFLVINSLVTIWNKNATKKQIKGWGDMAVEDEDTHFQV